MSFLFLSLSSILYGQQKYANALKWQRMIMQYVGITILELKGKMQKKISYEIDIIFSIVVDYVSYTFVIALYSSKGKRDPLI